MWFITCVYYLVCAFTELINILLSVRRLMELVLKSNRKLFLVTAGITFAVSMALYQWLVILMGLWALLMLGGVVPFGLKTRKL